uniref:Uncharacterized protein n=1 Tax=Romanomermis culicivorax TaxID=13658 RepID=A0A915HWR5_ROMCU
MRGEGTPPLLAIARVAKGIFGIAQRGRWSHCSCLSRFWAALRQHGGSHRHSIRTTIPEHTSIGCHADGRVRPATTQMVTTKWAQGSRGREEQTAQLGISGGDNDEYRTLIKIDCSHCSNHGCRGGGSHCGSHAGHEGPHGHQNERSASDVDNGRSRWYHGSRKMKCMFAYAMATKD